MTSLAPAVRAHGVRIRSYVALTKPRIVELLLVTTIPTMFVAARGVPSVGLMVATLVGGALAAGGANAFNMVVDRDIDRVMHRTRHRPLVTGELTPQAALAFAVILEFLAFAELAVAVNLLSAVLAVSATAFYVFVYKMWLKRTSSQNIVIGGALAAGGANAINMVVDRDIDRVMHRTRNRPLVTGAMTPRAALVFALVLEVVAFAELWGLVNLLSATLAVSATAFYVFVYSLWLKRRSTQNIVIGGAAGAVPTLVGWTAVT
ncbi:MAG TPA: UbiA family prenyltransferase, partial [Acidimicrobiales bacterium]|nr:UbiA family prenyltransferase [Acidimicrobiales bacterium]